jgi:hypothetical protein
MMHSFRAMMVPVCAVLVLVLTASARPEAPVAPEEAPVAPEETPVAPEEALVAPEEALVAPEEALVAPEEAPVVPEEALVAPGETLVMPEAAPAAPEAAPVAPQAVPVAPQAVPVAPPAAPAAPVAAAQDPWAKYQIILERNIFSRQRGPVRRPGEDRDTGPVKLPDPETHFVLKGIVQEDNEFIAFIEDTQAGTVLRLRQDDHVARGVIKALNLDGIEYQFEDRTTTVKLGYDLEGNLGPVSARARVSQPVPATSAAPAQPGTSTQPAASGPGVTSSPAGQPPTPAGDEGEILRRLMEQRRQQLGQ